MRALHCAVIIYIYICKFTQPTGTTRTHFWPMQSQFQASEPPAFTQDSEVPF